MLLIRLFFIIGLLGLVMAGCDSTPQQSEEKIGYLGKYVSDSAGLFSKADGLKLENILASYEDSLNLDFAVATVTSLGNLPLEEKSLQTAIRMGLGKPGINNGGLLFITQKERNIKILTGFGLEWQIPDSVSNMVLDRMILPRLREDDYFSGARDGIQTLVHEASQVNWSPVFSEFEEAQAAGETAIGKIVKFHARPISKAPSATILDYQFHPSYAIAVQTITGEEVKVYFSKYMFDMADQIAKWNDGVVVARIRNTNPWEVELLGVE